MLINAIARELDARLDGDGAIEIDRLVHADRASRPSDLALAVGGGAEDALRRTKARAVVVSAKKPSRGRSFAAVFTLKEPRIALERLTAVFDPGPAHGEGVHPSAVIGADAEIGPHVSIGPFVVVGARSRIGGGSVILSHVTIGAEVTIGANALVHPGVRIGDRIRIGERVILHPNVCIGIDGFSFAPDMASPIVFNPGLVLTRIHSLGTVEVGDDVEIGAATTIDRATIEATRIAKGTKIDNHVHIGHNVTIGEACIVCGIVGISGSVKIVDRVRLAGGVGIADHVMIGDEAIVTAASGVGSNVAAGSFVSGLPAQPHQQDGRAVHQYRSANEAVQESRELKAHRRRAGDPEVAFSRGLFAMTDVTKDVVDIIAKKKRAEKPTVEMTDRLEDLGLESIDAVEMIFDIEEKFDIQIPVNANNPRTEFDTVEQVVKAVQQLVDEQKK